MWIECRGFCLQLEIHAKKTQNKKQLSYPCSCLTETEIFRLWPSVWRTVSMSAHCTISPRGPPFSTLGLKTSPDSSVRKPTWTRIWNQIQDECHEQKKRETHGSIIYCVRLCSRNTEKAGVKKLNDKNEMKKKEKAFGRKKLTSHQLDQWFPK